MFTELEIIFLGAGGSACSPEMRCITAPSHSVHPPCHPCLSTLDENGELIAGHKNIRGTTSAIIRKTFEDGRQSTILIDCGKTFRDATLKYFRKNNLRRIDAVLLTHEHADAILGLDDLRGFTEAGVIQDVVDIYCDERTLSIVAKIFPWCVPGNPVMGSGKLPRMSWHVINAEVPVTIAGMEILPLYVQHGTTRELVSNQPLPQYLQQPLDQDFSTPPATPIEPPEVMRVPYYIFCYTIDRQIVYMSDLNAIPKRTMQRLLNPTWDSKQPSNGRRPPARRFSTSVDLETPPESDEEPSSQGQPHRYPLVVIDCDKIDIDPAKSHLSLRESFAVADQLKAQTTILTGLNHEFDWYGLQSLCQDVEGLPSCGSSDFVDQMKRDKLGPGGLLQRLEQAKRHLRPAFDGMRLRIKDGKVMQY